MLNMHEGYARAVSHRAVPFSVIARNHEMMEGKTEEEQNKLKDKFTQEILEKYPLKDKYKNQ